MCAAGREHHRRGRPSAGSTVGPASASPDPRREQWVVMTCCSRFDFGTASSVASALRRRSSAAWSDGRTAWRLNRRPRGPSLRDELDCGEPPARHSRPDGAALTPFDSGRSAVVWTTGRTTAEARQGERHHAGDPEIPRSGPPGDLLESRRPQDRRSARTSVSESGAA